MRILVDGTTYKLENHSIYVDAGDAWAHWGGYYGPRSKAAVKAHILRILDNH